MNQKIPKIIHYCWFGGKPLPEAAKKHIDTWRTMCPDYEIKEWSETNFDFNKYRYTKEAYDEKKWAFVSDVCRLEKVYEFGGIYIDVNTDVVKNLDSLLDVDLFIGFEQDNKIAAGIFGAKKGYAVVGSVLKSYKRERLIKDNGKLSMATINDRFELVLMKRGLLKDNTLQIYDDFTVYPKEYFHPRYWNSPEQDKLTANTFAVHFYGASWHDDDKRSFFNKLTSTEQPLVSIIVPIYNVEKYLAQCLDSLLRQTYKNIEIILVDDKSVDQSGGIADKYAAKNKHVEIIHKQENEGLNMARATGFDASAGEYIMFVDSDDLLVDNCVESAIHLIYKNNTDFVKFNFAPFKDTKTLLAVNKKITDQKLNEQSIIRGKKDLYGTRFVNDIVGLSTVCVWGGLYSASAVRNINWKESNYRINEDNFWTMQLFEHVGSGTYTSSVGYLYRSDESYQGVLSKKLSGNCYNGVSVGYLEFVDLYFKKFRHYNTKYKLELDHDIALLESWMWIDRLMNLVKKNMLNVEGNQDFLPTALSYLVQQYVEKRSLNDIRKNELKALQLENAKLRQKVDSLRSVKKSGRLFLGNIKRKIKSLVR
jgi:glycosyltransferase involved in cell wall biosynthesis